MRKLIMFLLLGTICAPAVCVAQPAQTAQTPEEVARAYLDAIQSEGFASIASFIHPDERERFRSMLLPLMLGDHEQAKGLRAAFFGPAATPESIGSMDAESFMRGFLVAMSAGIQSMKISLGDYTVIGSIREGELVHVVTRSTAGTDVFKVTKVEVMSLKLYKDSWRLLLAGELEGLAQALKARAKPDAR